MLSQPDLLAAELGQREVGDLEIQRSRSMIVLMRGSSPKRGAVNWVMRCRSRHTRLHLLRGQPRDALGAELLNVERRDGRAVRHRRGQQRRGRPVAPALRGDVARPSPPAKLSPAPVGSTTVSSGKAGSEKNPSSRDQHRAVLALLGDHRRRAHRRGLPRRTRDGRLAGQLAHLRVVQHHAVDALDHRDQIVTRGSRSRSSSSPAPSSAGCGTDRAPRTAAWAGCWLGTGRRSRAPLRSARLEVLEHPELRVERLARVQIPAVLAAQKNVFPSATTSTSSVSVPRVRSTSKSASAKSPPTGPTGRDRVEERGGQREMSGRSAEHPIALAERRLDGVVRERAHNRDRHRAAPRSSLARSPRAWAGRAPVVPGGGEARRDDLMPRAPHRPEPEAGGLARAAALSVRSQVKSGSSRPKWP